MANVKESRGPSCFKCAEHINADDRVVVVTVRRGYYAEDFPPPVRRSHSYEPESLENSAVFDDYHDAARSIFHEDCYLQKTAK